MGDPDVTQPPAFPDCTPSWSGLARGQVRFLAGSHTVTKGEKQPKCQDEGVDKENTHIHPTPVEGKAIPTHAVTQMNPEDTAKSDTKT